MENQIEFFLPMIPPTVTHQEHCVTVRNGKPKFYAPAELKTARNKLLNSLYPYRPEKPFDSAVTLIVKWLFPITGKHKDGEYKITSPDTDNLQKLLKDVMTDCGFWTDDARVASEHVEKFYAEITGIYIKVVADE